jgi:hypothetical protein
MRFHISLDKAREIEMDLPQEGLAGATVRVPL